MNLSGLNAKEKAKHFHKIENKNKNKKKNGKCMFSSCNNFAIGSHAISEKYHLKSIADNSIVYGVVSVRDKEERNLIIKNVEISKATVFPGFCYDHDKMFKSIDNYGIKGVKEIIHQCYRSVCYHLCLSQIDGDTLKEVQNNVDDTMRERYLLNSNIDYDKIRFDKFYKEKKPDSIKPIQVVKDILEEMLIISLDDTITKPLKIECEDLEIYYIKVDDVIPIVLNTMVSTPHGNVFHIVIPNDSSTDIIVINGTHKRIELSTAWDYVILNKLNLLDIIESWMVTNENWYIKPSVINSIPNERLKILHDDIRFCPYEKDLWERYDMSIFDELRNKYLMYYSDSLEETFIEIHKKKFQCNTRPTYEQREVEFKKKVAEYMYSM